MKHQVLFSLKNNEKIFIMSSAAVMIGALRVKTFSKATKSVDKFSLLYS